MNEPLRPPSRDITKQQIQVPATVGGWNTNDAMSMMPITDAVVMDNFMAHEGYVALREGYKNVAPTEWPNRIKDLGEIGTLMSYDVDTIANKAASTQTDSLIFVVKEPLAASAKIYKYRPNIPDTAPVTLSPVNAAIPNNKYNYILYRKTLMMTEAGNEPYWFIENAAGNKNLAKKLTCWFTGAPAEMGDIHDTMLDKVALYRDRLFFSIKDELCLFATTAPGNIPADNPPQPSPPPNPPPPLNWNIQLQAIDVSMFCSKGGSIAMIANWTKTGAESLHNFLVVITTQGEVLVFSGDDPFYVPKPNEEPDPQRWNFEGRFDIPKLIPNSNGVRVGGDFVVMTIDGYIGLGDMLNANFVNTDSALSNKINAAVKEVLRYTDFPYWNLTFSINDNLLIANVPTIKDGNQFQSHQHVLNLSTNAWCRFKGLNATCFATFKDKIYFAKIGGGLYRLFDGSTDDDEYIDGYIQQAYSDFQSPKIKTFIQADLVASDMLGMNVKVNFNVDFKASYNNSQIETSPISGIWNESRWDEAVWNSGGVSRIFPTLIVSHSGIFGSMGIVTRANYSFVKWYATILTMLVNK